MDWSNIDGSAENIVLGESSDPTARTSATSGRTTTRNDFRAPVQRRGGNRAGEAHAAAAAMKDEEQDQDQGTGNRWSRLIGPVIILLAPP